MTPRKGNYHHRADGRDLLRLQLSQGCGGKIENKIIDPATLYDF